MFDEIPRPDKSRSSRKQVWFWIGLCVLWIAIGIRDIERHNSFGWLLLAVWSFALLVWAKRVFSFWRDAQAKETEK
jgi:hypothetical protein